MHGGSDHLRLTVASLMAASKHCRVSIRSPGATAGAASALSHREHPRARLTGVAAPASLELAPSEHQTAACCSSLASMAIKADRSQGSRLISMMTLHACAWLIARTFTVNHLQLLVTVVEFRHRRQHARTADTALYSTMRTLQQSSSVEVRRSLQPVSTQSLQRHSNADSDPPSWCAASPAAWRFTLQIAT